MTPVVIDASALAAIAFGEPEGEFLQSKLNGAAVFAPALLKFELANVAWKKARRHPADGANLMRALVGALDPRTGIHWRDIDHVETVLIARATGVSTYDASYLWLAGFLGAELVTLDRRLAAAGEDWPLAASLTHG